MKAIVQRVYGSAEVLEFTDVDKPPVGDNDVFIRVHAAVPTSGKWMHALLLSLFVRQNLRPLSTVPNKKDLLFVKELIEAGKLTPAIDRMFALSEVPDAFRYVEQGHGRGKIVITV